MKKTLYFAVALLLLPSFAAAQFEFADGQKGRNNQGGQNPSGQAKNTFELVRPSQQDGNTPLEEPMPLRAPQEAVTAPIRPSSDIANPEAGPPETFVYVSEAGYWKITPPSSPPGRAKYIWPEDGTSHNDELYYLGFGNVIENEGFGVQRGSRVPTWAYQAMDRQGNSIYYYFGVRAIRPNPRGPGAIEVFPMYYSFDPPTSGAQPRRLLTESGTTRY